MLLSSNIIAFFRRSTGTDRIDQDGRDTIGR